MVIFGEYLVTKMTRYTKFILDHTERLPSNSKRYANIPAYAKLQIGDTATSA